MCKNVKIFRSLDEMKNREAQEALATIPWIEAEWIAAVELLDEVEEVPFLLTDEGDRYFGIKDILYFVTVQQEKGQL